MNLFNAFIYKCIIHFLSIAFHILYCEAYNSIKTKVLCLLFILYVIFSYKSLGHNQSECHPHIVFISKTSKRHWLYLQRIANENSYFVIPKLWDADTTINYKESTFDASSAQCLISNSNHYASDYESNFIQK